jgi:hypothetical protein
MDGYFFLYLCGYNIMASSHLVSAQHKKKKKKKSYTFYYYLHSLWKHDASLLGDSPDVAGITRGQTLAAGTCACIIIYHKKSCYFYHATRKTKTARYPEIQVR